MRLNPTTKEAYNQMRDLGLITYNAQAGYDFLVKNGIQPASRSVGDIEQALEGYVMKIEGAKKWNDKCDTTFRELASQVQRSYHQNSMIPTRTYSKLRKYFRNAS